MTTSWMEGSFYLRSDQQSIVNLNQKRKEIFRIMSTMHNVMFCLFWKKSPKTTLCTGSILTELTAPELRKIKNKSSELSLNPIWTWHTSFVLPQYNQPNENPNQNKSRYITCKYFARPFANIYLPTLRYTITLCAHSWTDQPTTHYVQIRQSWSTYLAPVTSPHTVIV